MNRIPHTLSALIASATARELSRMLWGLVPSWAKERTSGNRLINARADSVATLQGFRLSVEIAVT